jgi:hypothetical protein
MFVDASKPLTVSVGDRRFNMPHIGVRRGILTLPGYASHSYRGPLLNGIAHHSARSYRVSLKAGLKKLLTVSNTKFLDWMSK